MFRSPHQLRALDIQRRRVFQKRLLIFRRVLLHRHAIPGRVADDLVIDIRNIHHVADVIPTLPQEPIEQVHRNERAKISDVSVVVNRRPTGIHPDLVALQRLKFSDFCGECVVKTQSHG